ncbi:MAG TPA: ABC transporter permease [Spirochaetota bacterium]|nr:ABC transporter permease [Spirochaetota bacterium]HPC40847.1 ABC transporter permease [Spirochaetota bacterium]HPL17448.1 ABC transporter permease [Spirochaetota bacterium]HQF07763.1 ABC transporter permease [Spirochaetota bacterium]HQH96816.1 ABC transporter permease [Spirochaetota bacterium]
MEGEKTAMKKYLVKRILLIVPTLLGITFITYLMIRLAPGDYTKLKMGMEGALKSGSISREILEQEKKLYGLDKPIVVGYVDWLAKSARLDFGTSRKDGRPVSKRIAEALPITLTLNIISMIIIYIISIPMGVVSAVKKESAFDRGSSLVLFILYSLPTFWVGLLLLLYLGSGEYLNLFPLGGFRSDWAAEAGILTRILDVGWHLVLPVVTLTYGGFAFLSRYTRANMLEVINQQYIMTARAKGLAEKKVIFVHAFRNSLIPLITLMATLLPGLLGGSVIVESIFSVPGMGMLAFEAILSRDIPVIMAIETIAALLTLAGILVADLAYALADPRIRLEAKI